MIRISPYKDKPQVDKSSFIDPAATIIGRVKIGRNVYVAPGAVIRADEPKSYICIADNCNIQDRVVIHAFSGTGVCIGEKTSLSHGVIIHGPCKIGKSCFIGFGSVVLAAQLADNIFIRNLAVVEQVKIPSGKYISSSALINSASLADNLKRISKKEISFIKKVARINLQLVKGYKNVDRLW